MKSILIVSGIWYPDIGGPVSYGRVIARELSSSLSVTVLTYSAKRTEPSDAALPYRVVRVWRKIPKPFRQLRYFLRALFLGRRADAIYSLGSLASGFPCALAARILHQPFYMRVSGDRAWESAATRGATALMIGDFQKSERRGLSAILHWMQVWSCKTAVRITTQSEYLSTLVAGWGIPREKIITIYNGSDFTPSTLSKEEARKKIGISGWIIVSIGRLVPWKGFRMLIKIMPRLLELNSFSRLVIMGDGPEQRSLATMVKNLGLQGKVFLVGKKKPDDVALYLAAADLFVLNTGYEGFSHQILEAMIAGVPIVTTSAGGNREIIKQGENGFMVKYNDEFNLFEAIQTLMKDKELCAQFSARGKQTAARFSARRMLSETKTFLGLSTERV